MINDFNVKIFDFIFSTSLGLKNGYISKSNESNFCEQLKAKINEICEEHDFWSEYQYYFNDDCVVPMGILDSDKYIYHNFPRMKFETLNNYYEYKFYQIKKSINNNGDFLKMNLKRLHLI